MRKSCLIGADLRGARLWGTNLESAILVEADLRGAEFIRANLLDADLSDVRLENTYSDSLTVWPEGFDLETAGIWAVDVRVESELGDGTTIMSVLVAERGRSGSGNVWGQVLFGLIALSFVLGITWVWWSSKKALKRRDQQS